MFAVQLKTLTENINPTTHRDEETDGETNGETNRQTDRETDRQ